MTTTTIDGATQEFPGGYIPTPADLNQDDGSTIVGQVASNLLSTTEAAAELNVTKRRVNAMIKDKVLPAEKIGGRHVIRRKDVEKLKTLRGDRLGQVGRPRKKT